MEFKPCILIPHFNHSDLISDVLTGLKPFQIPCVVVDDGSEPEHRRRVRELCREFDSVELTENSANLGKGGAVIAGMNYAHGRGYTHAIQVDADGQHDLNSLLDLVETARNNPKDLVTGYPIYGDDIPRERKWGRFVTHFWVWVETLSFEIKDSMCGFRAYPLRESLSVVAKNRIGSHMEFDTQILVNLYWAGTRVHQIPVKVAYPPEGRSHFHYLHDNVRISWAHTRLFFGMLRRLPRWMLNGFRPKANAPHWVRQKETGSVLGMKILLQVYAIFGRRVLDFVLYFVVGYYFCFARQARLASKLYLRRYREWVNHTGQVAARTSSFEHLYQFASSMLDKVAVWRGDIRIQDVQWDDHTLFDRLVKARQGAVFLTSHFGNIETIRSLVRQYPEIKINVMMHTGNAAKFNALLRSLNMEVSLNTIEVPTIGLETGVLLEEKISRGEWIFIMADRKSPTAPGRVLPGRFLGLPVELPYGPFALGDLLEAPVYTLHCYQYKGRFRVSLAEISGQVEGAGKSRSQRGQEMASLYLRELERLVAKAPLQWFNFFDFWELHD